MSPQFSSTTERQRDIFPLPPFEAVSPPNVERSRSFVSAKCRRRAGGLDHAADDCNKAIRSLNVLNDHSFNSSSPATVKPNLAQRQCIKSIRQAIHDFGAPPDPHLSPTEALRELRASHDYSGVPKNLAPLDLQRLSLPDGSSKPVSLDCFGFDGQSASPVGEFCKSILLPQSAVEDKLSNSPKHVYLDPSLRNPRTYIHFIRKLHKSHIVQFGRKCHESVGAFTVKKKNNSLRLVIDARRSNAWFCDPPSVDLATGAALSEIATDDGSEWFVASLDIANAFYSLELPSQLRAYFCLPGLRAGDINITLVEGEPVDKSIIIYPQLAVVPMGWTHALAACQKIHEYIVDRTGLHPELRVRDNTHVAAMNSHDHNARLTILLALVCTRAT